MVAGVGFGPPCSRSRTAATTILTRGPFSADSIHLRLNFVHGHGLAEQRAEIPHHIEKSLRADSASTSR